MSHPGGRPTLSQSNGKAQLAGLLPGIPDRISNGIALAITSRPGRAAGEREVIGIALAYLPGNLLHPFVVWGIAAGNGEPLYVGAGDYCRTLDEAWRIYRSRGKRL